MLYSFRKTLIPLCACVLVLACQSEVETPENNNPDPETQPEPEPEPEVPDPDFVGDPQDDASFLFDAEQVHTFELDVAVENMEFLDSDPVAEEYVPGTLKFNGEEYAEVGVRYKGSIGSFVGCTETFGFPPSGGVC